MGIDVKLLHRPNLGLVLIAAQTCTDTVGRYGGQSLLKKCLERGHESIFEHAVYTFQIKGITRALLQELARHRHISLSVKSTRYTLGKMTTEDIESICNNLHEITAEHRNKLGILHDMTREILEEIAHLKAAEKIPNDILKYFLPEAVTTDLILTVNARELRHIFMLRAAPSALKEFNKLCVAMRAAVPMEHAFLYKDCADWGRVKP